jgi:transketolase C-terminal domain/subunit
MADRAILAAGRCRLALHSGKAEQLLEHYGITAANIAAKVRAL